MNPNERQAEANDMWRWLRLLGWRAPIFESADPKSAMAVAPDSVTCRLGIVSTPTESDTTATSPSIDEERALGWAIVNDDCVRAKERLFFLGLPTLARSVDAYGGRGLTTAELIESGATGLRQAVTNFDPAPGVRFSTIASWWIKQSIKEAMIQHRNVPVNA